jgi:hypothetical protein
MMEIAVAGILVMVAVAILATRANERALQRTINGPRTFDAGRVDVRQLRRFDLQGDVLPADDDTPRALAPYDPQTIRVNLPQAPAAPAWELTRHTAQRAPALESDVFVPGLQAVFTALAVFIGSGLIAWALGWSWRVPVVVTGLALACAWLWRMGVVTALLWRVESVMQRDLTGDGIPGKPQNVYTVANPQQARAEAAQAARENTDMSEAAALLDFVRQCALKGCSESALGIPPSPGERKAYCEKRDLLIALGVATWKNPARRRLGWQLAVTPEQAAPIIQKHVLNRHNDTN